MRTNEKISAKTISLTGLMMAIIFVFTYFAKFPIPLGYANLGSTAILIGAFLIGRWPGVVAGAVGAALSDLLLGYVEWCIPTLIVKGVMVIIYILIAGNNNYNLKIKVILGAVFSNVWAAIGYTIFGAILYGSWGAGLASSPGLFIESAINTVLFIVVVQVLSKTNTVKSLKL